MAGPSASAAPRFRPGRGPRTGARIGGLIVALSAVLLLGLTGANYGRLGLRCIDGKLEARRGTMLPWGERPVDDPLFVPLAVPDALCRDSNHRSRRALETAYIEAAVASVDAAIAGGSADDLQRSLASLELVLAAGDERVDTDALERRRRALLLARLRVEVEQARTSRQRAMTRIDQARAAGLDEAYLDQLEAELVDPPAAAKGDGGAPVEDPADESTGSSRERAL